MKKIIENKYFQIGLTAFLVIAASILFYFTLFHIGAIVSLFKWVIKILMPLIYGLVLAYIMHPIVDFFDKKVLKKVTKDTLRRNLSIACSFIIFVGLLITLISFIIPQLLVSVQSLIINAPVYFKNLEEMLVKWVNDNPELQNAFTNNYDSITEWLTTSLNNVVLPAANNAMTKLSSGIFGIFSFIFNICIGFVFAIYILANTKNFGAGLRKTLYSLFNVEKVNGFIDEVKHINHVFCQFMVGKLCDSLLFVFTCTLLFLLIFKYPYALLIAVIVGLTDLIPYFGPYIGSVPSALLICMVSPVKALTFILFMVLLQQVDANLVTPRIQTQATGLPSFWVLFSITLFGGLFGIVGLLIAVPCFTIIYELFIERTDKRLKKKNMPTETEYYEAIDGLEKKVIKADVED